MEKTWRSEKKPALDHLKNELREAVEEEQQHNHHGHLCTRHGEGASMAGTRGNLYFQLFLCNFYNFPQCKDWIPLGSLNMVTQLRSQSFTQWQLKLFVNFRSKAHWHPTQGVTHANQEKRQCATFGCTPITIVHRFFWGGNKMKNHGHCR